MLCSPPDGELGRFRVVGGASDRTVTYDWSEGSLNMDKLVLILLAIWALLFGIVHVTNIQVQYGQVIMGLAALALGVVCIIKAFR